MKKLFLFSAFVFVALMIVGVTGSYAQKKMTKEQVIWPADQIKWEEVPNTGGVKRAILWGNADKGASGVFYKFPAGANFPLHYHTNGMKIVVLSGTLLYTPEGGSENRLGPGSYLSYGPKDHHVSGTVQDAECTFFAEQPGKFDLVPIEVPKK